jgi:UDP-3-O-[3-hydroxymyristoyl] N-acetylglucosamine deacetylase
VNTVGPTDGSSTLRGVGLHSGLPTAVTLERIRGCVRFVTEAGETALDALTVLRADHGVRVACRRTGLDVDGVEHLLAALGGLRIAEGVGIRVEGGEVPLLDGGALAFARALLALDPPPGPPALAVVCAGEVKLGASLYRFEPAAGTAIDVEIAFDAPAIGIQHADWDGRPETFLDDIAWARTFGFRSDESALRAAGRARGVDPRTVMVLDDAGQVESPGAPARPGEFARHKLLDLVGDLRLFGGPPTGRVRAVRPGHAATHHAIATALSGGLLKVA